MDPIEKKPLFHFFPGTGILSLATAGCNFRCLNCQNWEISQASPFELKQYDLGPADVIHQALKHQTNSIAFTYTEPTVFYEYMLEIATLAHKEGLKTVMISNGYINKKPLLELCPVLDAANIDLKAFGDQLYHQLTGGRLQPVLDTLKALKEKEVWLEITQLLIPSYSDDPAMIETMCHWLIENGFQDTPLHFSRFFPMYKLSQITPTPTTSLVRAKDIAVAAGMKYVYIGNMPGLHGENTHCSHCHKLVIEREGYEVNQYNLKAGCCSYCGEPVAGVWT